jgi:hypothetical protein
LARHDANSGANSGLGSNELPARGPRTRLAHLAQTADAVPRAPQNAPKSGFGENEKTAASGDSSAEESR